MIPYADTNFFSRVYLALPESDQADRLLEAARKQDCPLLPITWLHQLELANAFELSVWLGKQGGHPRVTSENAAVALHTFKAIWQAKCSSALLRSSFPTYTRGLKTRWRATRRSMDSELTMFCTSSLRDCWVAITSSVLMNAHVNWLRSPA